MPISGKHLRLPEAMATLLAVGFSGCVTARSQSLPFEHSNTPSAAVAPPLQHEELLVHGDDFLFGVSEPVGWRGDTADLAAFFHVNVVFIPAGTTNSDYPVSLRARVNPKNDDDIALDMRADMDDYSNRFPGIQFRSLEASHSTYHVESRLFLLPSQFSEYVAYLNPGSQYPCMFSVALSVHGREASLTELLAFRQVLASLRAVRTADKQSVSPQQGLPNPSLQRTRFARR